MVASISTTAPGLGALDMLNATLPNKPKPTALQAKARGAAQDFEAVFLNSMFQQMFTGINGDGPFGGGGAGGVWRSFLSEEYAKNFAKSGGVGIADQVYRTLLARQGAAQ